MASARHKFWPESIDFWLLTHHGPLPSMQKTGVQLLEEKFILLGRLCKNHHLSFFFGFCINPKGSATPFMHPRKAAMSPFSFQIPHHVRQSEPIHFLLVPAVICLQVPHVSLLWWSVLVPTSFSILRALLPAVRLYDLTFDWSSHICRWFKWHFKEQSAHSLIGMVGHWPAAFIYNCYCLFFMDIMLAQVKIHI